MCSHYAYPANYSAIFAPSCSSIGDLTDSKQFEDGTLAITEETLAWLRVHGLRLVPRSIKAMIGDLVYINGQSSVSIAMEPPPGLWPAPGEVPRYADVP